MTTSTLKNKQRVRVYRNLRTGTLSVQKKGKNGWRVSHYLFYAKLENCVFTVRPGGRDRVRRTGRKNVHAWIEGDLISDNSIPVYENLATYNPLTNDGWTTKDGSILTAADKVSIINNGKVTYTYDENKCGRCGREKP